MINKQTINEDNASDEETECDVERVKFQPIVCMYLYLLNYSVAWGIEC